MDDNGTLAGRRALVTGGASGIGAAICRDLAAGGAEVVVLDIDATGAERLSGELGSELILGGVDLTDPSLVDGALARLDDAGADIDILVNNAGISEVTRFIESDPSSWDRLWRINLRAPMQLTHGLLPGMMKRGWGRLVFVSTDAAKAGAGGESVYAACKGGLHGFAKSLAREAAASQVTSNVVCPGLVETPMLEQNRERFGNVIDALTRSIPLRRAGLPEEVSGLISFLCSDRAAYITGQALSVSGGMTMT